MNTISLEVNNTLDQYIHGVPEEAITATLRPRILVIGLHGSEDLAARVAFFIHKKRLDLTRNVDYICGNPKAAAKQIRATNLLSDLNRSFRSKGKPKGYEEKRAEELLLKIRGYDYVLDVHTSETECGRFFLAPNSDSPKVRNIIACSKIDRIVVLPKQLTDPALIGNVSGSISIEYNEVLARKPQAIAEIIEIIDGLINNITQNREREFFEVGHAVSKDQDPGDIRNFELCEAGYYPVLFGVGPKSYRNDPSKNYLGFAATKMQQIIL